jgi:DNA-binding GntR family transcriptional regulator
MPPAAAIELRPVEESFALKDRIYGELRAAILDVDVYADRGEHRLDERQLSQQLGVSRTPVREALQRLEHEGLVVSLPRRGTFVARKTKQEIIETITAWAALESMAARLATLHGSDAEIRRLREMFGEFAEGQGQVQARIDEYSETNLRFHQAILRMGKSQVLDRLADNLLLHMRSIRKHTIGERDRAERSIIDHMHIIEALEARDTDRAERLVRQHSLDLAAHVEAHVDWLD